VLVDDLRATSRSEWIKKYRAKLMGMLVRR
jgi:hypothetical protein